jgi:hypothetical protein
MSISLILTDVKKMEIFPCKTLERLPSSLQGSQDFCGKQELGLITSSQSG